MRTPRTPLRFRLVAAVVVLVAAALTVSGLVAVTSLRGYLVGQVDRQLIDVASSPSVIERPPSDLPQFSPGDRNPGPQLPTDFYVGILDDSGGVIRSNSATGTAGPDVSSITAAKVRSEQGRPFSVPGQGGEPSWRVVASARQNGSRVVARSLAEVDSIVARLSLLLLGIGLIVLVMVAVVGYFIVRRSLAPLVEVERATTAIANGDLSRRVPAADPRTEVGQLSVALNVMLMRLEAAFAAREAALGEAQASEARMRQFVADASHELRTPLTSIRGLAELYRQGAIDDAGIDRAFTRIEGEATRMGGLVDDLLLLARLDQRRPLEQQPVDLIPVAGDTVHDARAAHPDRDITLTVLPGSQAPIVLGDEARLRQVAVNLVGNALTHTDGPVQVKVGTTAGIQRAHAVLEVLDNGPGLDDEAKSRVFERFYRASADRSRDRGGAGLGLSIVAALVTAHGGSITILDTPGGGAIFRVEIPLAPADDRTPQPQPSPGG